MTSNPRRTQLVAIATESITGKTLTSVQALLGEADPAQAVAKALRLAQSALKTSTAGAVPEIRSREGDPTIAAEKVPDRVLALDRPGVVMEIGHAYNVKSEMQALKDTLGGSNMDGVEGTQLSQEASSTLATLIATGRLDMQRDWLSLIGTIFKWANGSVLGIVFVALLFDQVNIHANAGQSARLLTDNVLLALIGGTIVQAAAAAMVLSRFLFPSVDPADKSGNAKAS